MDASMRQKVALTAAHLLCEGDVADMGMGSGSGSFALAALYPELRVVGVDVNRAMVERARERHVLPNLTFLEGDVAAPCFEPASMEAILSSSVLHHVTSFGDYDRTAAGRAVAVQAAQLADGGVLIVRDFVDPGPGRVWLDVLATDGDDDAADPTTCSTAALLERFATEFRSLRPPAERGFACAERAGTRACPLAPGFRRYELSHTHAVEFVLRKDYRQSWDVEVQEEYTYATQSELEAMFTDLGLRVLASTPIFNPWIVQHRFRDKLRLWRVNGEELDFPPTNFVIVGQRVGAEEGVRIHEASSAPALGYLVASHYENVVSGRIFDLARRPGATLDVVPWFERDGALFVLARRSYPRPVLGIAAATPRLDGAAASTYVTEPLIVMCSDKPLGQTVEEQLLRFPGIVIHGMERGPRYLPSPGGLQEQVESVFVAIEPVNVQTPLSHDSGFSTAGTLRAMEVRQLLRAAQVGGLPDARLELNGYELLFRHQSSAGAWIGETIELHDTDHVPATAMADLIRRPHRRAFRPTTTSADFLAVRSAVFVEEAANGTALHRQTREWVMPRELSTNTVVVAALMRHRGRLFIGLDDDDLPAAQCFDGNSEILVAPAWRLPQHVRRRAHARQFVRDRLQHDYGVTVHDVWDLGGAYHPSAGITPEVAFPLAMACAGPGTLTWVAVEDALAHRSHLREAHLGVVLWRAAHACGLLG